MVAEIRFDCQNESQLKRDFTIKYTKNQREHRKLPDDKIIMMMSNITNRINYAACIYLHNFCVSSFISLSISLFAVCYLISQISHLKVCEQTVCNSGQNSERQTHAIDECVRRKD